MWSYPLRLPLSNSPPASPMKPPSSALPPLVWPRWVGNHKVLLWQFICPQQCCAVYGTIMSITKSEWEFCCCNQSIGLVCELCIEWVEWSLQGTVQGVDESSSSTLAAPLPSSALPSSLQAFSMQESGYCRPLVGFCSAPLPLSGLCLCACSKTDSRAQCTRPSVTSEDPGKPTIMT